MAKETKVMRLTAMERNVIELLREKKEQVNKELRFLLYQETPSDFMSLKELHLILEDRTFYNSEQFQLDNLVALNTLTEDQSTILKEAIDMNKNIIIMGNTAVGKTTLMYALLKYKFENHSDRRTVLVEKNPELKKHVPAEQEIITRDSGGLKLSDLSFLNESKSQLVINEIMNSEDIQSIVYALDKRSSVLSTMHGNNFSKRINALNTDNLSFGGKEVTVVTIEMDEEYNRKISIKIDWM